MSKIENLLDEIEIKNNEQSDLAYREYQRELDKDPDTIKVVVMTFYEGRSWLQATFHQDRSRLKRKPFTLDDFVDATFRKIDETYDREEHEFEREIDDEPEQE